MPHPSHLTKILNYKGEDIEFFNIFTSTKDDLFRMKVKCESCDRTQCRCFKSIEEAILFEGFICSNRCFVLVSHGDDEVLEKIIDDMELKVPLELLEMLYLEKLVMGL